MSKSPIVSFGLTAVSMGMKAMSGTVSALDKLALCRSVLSSLPGNLAAARAVEAFLSEVDQDAAGAGRRLRDFASDLAHASTGGTENKRVDEPKRYDWQDRADLQ